MQSNSTISSNLVSLHENLNSPTVNIDISNSQPRVAFSINNFNEADLPSFHSLFPLNQSSHFLLRFADSLIDSFDASRIFYVILGIAIFMGFFLLLKIWIQRHLNLHMSFKQLNISMIIFSTLSIYIIISSVLADRSTPLSSLYSEHRVLITSALLLNILFFIYSLCELFIDIAQFDREYAILAGGTLICLIFIFYLFKYSGSYLYSFLFSIWCCSWLVLFDYISSDNDHLN